MKNYLLSFDISTTNVGVSLWDSTGKLIELKHLELKIDKSTPPEDRYIYKSNLFRNYCIEYKNKIEKEYNGVINNIFVEAPLSNTPKNINTTALLLGFNGIASYKLYEVFNIIPKKITVHNARKVFCPEFVVHKKQKGVMKEVLSFPKGWRKDEKKEYIRKKVALLEPQIKWFYNRNGKIRDSSYDLSDSYAVGLCGLIVIGIIDPNRWLEVNNECVKALT